MDIDLTIFQTKIIKRRKRLWNFGRKHAYNGFVRRQQAEAIVKKFYNLARIVDKNSN